MNFECSERLICINPESELIFKNKKHFIEIYLAEYSGKWSYGYSFTHDNFTGGGVSGVCFDGRRSLFEIREEARDLALRQMLTVFWNDKYQDVRKVIKSKFETQMSLF